MTALDLPWLALTDGQRKPGTGPYRIAPATAG